jgi:GxxExxY protein
MNANERELVLRDEVYQIVGAAIEVANTLGHGLLEKPYERALMIELGLRSMRCAVQRPFEVIDKGASVGHYVPDLIVIDQIIVEIKCIEKIGSAERAQLLNYLRITKMPVGVILNFKRPKLEWERLALSL